MEASGDDGFPFENEEFESSISIISCILDSFEEVVVLVEAFWLLTLLVNDVSAVALRVLSTNAWRTHFGREWRGNKYELNVSMVSPPSPAASSGGGAGTAVVLAAGGGGALLLDADDAMVPNIHEC
jgi:hypothetical protein